MRGEREREGEGEGEMKPKNKIKRNIQFQLELVKRNHFCFFCLFSRQKVKSHDEGWNESLGWTKTEHCF